jgi:hypothetical protein
MIKISKKLNNIIFVLFALFILANQFAIYATFGFISYFFFILMLSLICISYFHDRKKIYKQSINFQNFIFLLIFFSLIYYYFQNESNFSLKMIIYLIIILLISNLIYQKNDLVLILHTTLLIATLLLIIGFFGWFYGGESDLWGKQYIYFGYRYLPGTRNQDCQIFLLAYIISLFFIFSEKKIKIYLILNSLFSVALFLSYSRGYWLIYLVIFSLALLINIFFQYIETKKFFKIYFLNIVFIISIIFLLNTFLKLSNPNTQLTLQNQFYIKISSVLNFTKLDKNMIDINTLNNNSLSHLEATSINSWVEKYDQLKLFKELAINKKIFLNQYRDRYLEFGILFIFLNYPFVFLLYAIYFSKQFYFIFTDKRWHNKINVINIILLVSFLYINSIYNLIIDSVSYFYFLQIVIFKKLLLDKSMSKSSL